MTTTRINHTGHNHPNTTAARTACRKVLAATPATATFVQVGNGSVVHRATVADDGTVLGAICGAGLQRGLRKSSTFTAITLPADTIPSCHRCH